MNRADWDAYLDGTMTLDDRKAIDARLAEDPALLRELEGFKAFRAAIRQAGMSVAIPEDRLQRALASTVQKPAAPPHLKWALRLSPLVAIAIVAAMVYWPQGGRDMSGDGFAFVHTPAIEAITVSNPRQAAKWIFERTTIPTPPVTMGSTGKLFAARCGEGWGRFDFGVRGHTVNIYVAMSDTFQESAKVSIGGFTYYRGATGLGWRDNGLSFYADGCVGDVLNEAITATRVQLDALPKTSPSRGSLKHVR